MADSENRKDEQRPEGEEYQESPLVDIFNEDSLSDTKRISLDELNASFDSADRAGAEPEEEDAEDLEIEERDYRPIRSRRDGRLGCLGGIMYAVFIISVSIILTCVGWMAASDVLALNKETVDATITLPKDIFTQEERDVTDEDGNVTGTKTVQVADIDYVADQLKDEGIIEYKWLFKLFAKVSNASTKLAPGTYELSTRQDYRALITNMQVGTESMVVTTITFPEGYTMAQIFQKLEDENICSVEPGSKTPMMSPA